MGPSFRIYIEAFAHDLDSQQLTVEEIKRLGHMPHGDRVYRECTHGHADVLLADDQTLVIEGGERFYSAPRGLGG
jgi:hypothetical protein